MKPIAIIAGTIALWALGMLALILFYIPTINHHAVLTIAAAGGFAILILIMFALSK